MSWELVDDRDGYEFRTGADGEGVERREVREIVRKRSVTSYPTSREAGTLAGSLTFLWNGATQIKALTGGKRFYCSTHNVTRTDIPGNGGEEVQTWIYYGRWETFEGFDP